MRGRPFVPVVMVAMCLATAAIPLSAAAQQPDKRPKMRSMQQRMLGQHRWWQDQATAAELGLTDQQIQQLDEMAQRGREQARPARHGYLQAYRALVDTLSSGTATDETIAALRGEVIRAWSELISVGVDQLVEMRGILSDEQWAMLPKAAPQALRLGSVTLRGTGVVTPDAPPDDGS